MHPAKKRWQKLLYVKQDFPDNYTDKGRTFLRDLRYTAASVTVKEATVGGAHLLEEFTTVVTFVLCYVYLLKAKNETHSILGTSSVLTAFGFVWYRFSGRRSLAGNSGDELHPYRKFGQDLRTLLIFIVFVYLFSPILHTLTDTISTNTIHTTSFLMLLVHLVFYDYGAVGAALVSNSLSLSAAIFAAICLASRLPTAFDAFILISIAIEVFVLWPLFRRRVRRPVVFSFVLCACDACFLINIGSDWVFLELFVATVVFIIVVCPALFVYFEKYKVNIYGPWDEAVLDN